MGEARGARLGRPAVRALVASVLGVVMIGATPAATRAATNVEVVTARSTFVPGDEELVAPLVITAGTGITLTNLDPHAAHAMTSDTILPDGSRLFGSPALNFRASAEVAGVDALPPGTYGFHCSVHEDNMRGTLAVR